MAFFSEDAFPASTPADLKVCKMFFSVQIQAVLRWDSECTRNTYTLKRNGTLGYLLKGTTVFCFAWFSTAVFSSLPSVT